MKKSLSEKRDVSSSRHEMNERSIINPKKLLEHSQSYESLNEPFEPSNSDFDTPALYQIKDVIRKDVIDQWITSEFQINPSSHKLYFKETLRIIVTKRESMNIDKLFPDMYKEVLELVAKKALTHLTTETSSLQQFLPDLKGCITKLEKTVEETKIILEGTGQLKPQILEIPPIIELENAPTSDAYQNNEQLLTSKPFEKNIRNRF